MDILIVDDDPSVRDMLGECLADEGYNCITARHGQEALDILRTSTELPYLIVLDLAMPVMNGWDFLAIKQRDPVLAAIAVIVFSADRGTHQRRDPQAKIATIEKPIDIDILLDLIATYRR